MTRASSGRGAEVRAAVVALAITALSIGIAGTATGSSMLSYQKGGFDTSGWWFHLRTTGYSYQSGASGQSVEDRFGFYQVYDGAITGLAEGRLSLRVAGRFADDLALDAPTTDQNRLYTGYAQWRWQRWTGRVRLGRQFLQEGPTSVTLDGLWLAVKPLARWELKGWAGARSPAGKTYDVEDLGDETVAGARLLGMPVSRLRLGLSWAYRKERGQVEAQPLGLQATYALNPGMRFVGSMAYDLEGESWKKAEILGRFQPWRELPILTLQYLDRAPSISTTSYFARFGDLDRVRAGRATLRYERPSGYGAELEYFGSYARNHNSSRVGVALLARIVRVGYSARLGDAGEENRFFGDLTYRPVSWLDLAAGATLSTYALLEDAPESDERDLVTAFGRVAATLRNGLRLMAEVQSLDNPFYKEDVRLLVGLDLAMGRGPSGFGLQRGGWLQ